MRVIFDGPGKALWLMPAVATPEVELLRKGRPAASPFLLGSALKLAITFNDSAAVKALAAAGVDLKGLPDQAPLTAVAASVGAREAALARIEAGAPV